ncbi:MAG: hypothetical protein VR65_07615 [Desulfobulbaceae bacterium BRH_c16a]|nr:MAG: hypothetical protein VR65_07615 [Desulfobulbaceae bacterium BRH_c16a]
MKFFIGNFSHEESGFSLVELIVYLAILGILMTAVVITFTQTMRNTAQQSSIAETKIEAGIGLGLLRSDLEHAGFGLPWQFPAVPLPYSEPGPMADAPNDIPRALISEDASASSFNASDYLVIRATNVIRGVSGQKWGYVGRDINRNITIQSMSGDIFLNADNVIVIRPESSPGMLRQLVMNASNYVTKPTAAGMANYAPIATPNDPDGERFLVYGLNDGGGNISRPFNRTDYYINNGNVPTHCAPNTGVLFKATVNQGDNNFNIMPIVDCVADFQIVYYLDNNGDGGWDLRVNANGLNGLSAAEIRDQVKAVRYFILSHEGGLDRTYTYPNPTINVGEVAADGVTLVAGRLFDINATIGGNWANYRWKIESMAITPKNLK